MSINSTTCVTEEFDNLLYFGYYIDRNNSKLPPEISKSVIKEKMISDEEYLIEKGIEVLNSVFDSNIKSIKRDKTHIVPLSGGLDSRTILGALLNHEQISKSQIITVTFGVPGTWDFELGRKVAREVGVRNIPIDLTAVGFPWTSENLVNCANRLSSPVPIWEAYINSIPYKNFMSNNSVFWSGFMGEPSVGDHQPQNPSKTWNKAVQSFISSNKISSEKLTKKNFQPEKEFPTEPFLDRRLLTYEEQLDYAIRQQNYIKPATIPSEMDYMTPFMTEEWLSFWLNIPFSYRKDRTCFKKVVLSAYTDLFNRPSATNYGLSIARDPILGKIHGGLQILYNLARSTISEYEYVHPNENYADFEMLLRDNNILKSSSSNLLHSLNNRNVGNLDINKVWREHQQGIDHSTSIQTLISIECFIRSRNS